MFGRVTISAHKVSKVILFALLLWVITMSFLGASDLIFKETGYIFEHPFLSAEEKLRKRTDPGFYDFINFIKQNTPEDAVIMIPPQSGIWPFSGHIDYVQYFLYPRRLVKDNRERILTDNSITHILISWGEGKTQDDRLQGFPKYYVPVKKILTLTGQKVSYPDKPPYFEKYGIIEIERGRDENESLKRLINDSVEYHFYRAEFLRARGKYKEAIGELSLAEKLKPNAWTYYLLGDSWEKLNQTGLAINFYNRAIKHSPETGWFYFTLGQIYEKLGDKIHAEAIYLDGLSVAPDSTWSSFALGRMYEEEENLLKAALFYEKANFLNVKYNSFDSNNGFIALENLKNNYPDISKLLINLKNNREFSARLSDNFTGKEDKLMNLLNDEISYQVFFPNKFPSRDGAVEFNWQPPEDINMLSPNETIDLLHQLGYWQPHNGTIYLWAGPSSLTFGMFDLEQRKWYFLTSKNIKWFPSKMYLISIGFGRNGMFLSVDGELRVMNDYSASMALTPVFLGGGRILSLPNFPKSANNEYGKFYNFRFIAEQNN